LEYQDYNNYSINCISRFFYDEEIIIFQLQLKPNGGSFATVGQCPVSIGVGAFQPISICALIRISNTLDQLQLYYNQTSVYSNAGADVASYGGSYLPRFMTIKFISL
jgi:hypothetical protein